MASHGLVYSILYAFGAICGWGGVSLGISAVASNQWIWYGSATTFGLWNTCFVRQCTPIANAESWLLAVRAMVILAIVFAFLGNIAAAVSSYTHNRKAQEGAGTVHMIAALFGVVAGSVYSGVIGQNPSTAYFYGYGYILMWTSVGLLFLANLFNQLSARKMKTRGIENESQTSQ